LQTTFFSLLYIGIIMAKTDFAAMTTETKNVWARDVWKVARNKSFLQKFTGTDHNAMIHRITELTKTERGTEAIYILVPDLEGDGVTGDYDLEGNEEAIKAFTDKVQIDQMRNANRNTGRMADQATVVNFRKTSRDVLGYWLADRYDQQGFLTLSGIAYTQTNNGGTRPVKSTGQNMGDLAYAADVSAPTANRILRVSGDGLDDTSNASLTANDKFGYRHIVEAMAFGRDNYIRGVKGDHGSDIYHFFLTPQGMANLKLDADFLANVRNAGIRGSSNSLFAGGESFMIDGAMVHSYRHVYSNDKQADGSKWGASNNIGGQRVLMCGAQSLAMADIGAPYWDEDVFDYKNQYGISIGKICGMKKPVFRSAVTDTDEDFGVVCIDAAI
jgi:N4-gp56 family major capsid protein